MCFACRIDQYGVLPSWIQCILFATHCLQNTLLDGESCGQWVHQNNIFHLWRVWNLKQENWLLELQKNKDGFRPFQSRQNICLLWECFQVQKSDFAFLPLHLWIESSFQKAWWGMYLVDKYCIMELCSSGKEEKILSFFTITVFKLTFPFTENRSRTGKWANVATLKLSQQLSWEFLICQTCHDPSHWLLCHLTSWISCSLQ